VILPKAQEHFDRCKMFTGSFVVKEPRPNSFVPPHQDWSFTDDIQFNSVTVFSFSRFDFLLKKLFTKIFRQKNDWF